MESHPQAGSRFDDQTKALDGATALGNLPTLEVAAHSVVPALVLSFDRTWFERFDGALPSRLFDLAVLYCEYTGSRLGELYGYALQHPQLFSSRPAAHAGLFGVALLEGDFENATGLAKLADGGLRSTLLAALAVAKGAFAEQHAFVPPKKDEPVGVARLLQDRGVLARLADAELSACLADDMGLGKTLQAIALLLYRARQGPALIVAPTSVCDNWRRELTRFAPSLELRVFAGAGRERELERLGPRQVVITSYALLQQSAEQLQAVSFATAILDEAQLIKNAESQRARAACSLDAKVRVALTGTPVENHIGDLYSIFRFSCRIWSAHGRRSTGALAPREAPKRAILRSGR